MKKILFVFLFCGYSALSFAQENYYTYNSCFPPLGWYSNPNQGEPHGMEMTSAGKIFTWKYFDHDDIFMRYDSSNGLYDYQQSLEHRYFLNSYDANQLSENMVAIGQKYGHPKMRIFKSNNQYLDYFFGMPTPGLYYKSNSFVKIFDSNTVLIFVNANNFPSTQNYSFIYKYDFTTNQIVDTSSIISNTVFTGCTFDNAGNIYISYNSPGDGKIGIAKFTEGNLNLIWNKKVVHNGFQDEAKLITVSSNSSTIELIGMTHDSLVTFSTNKKVLFVRMTSNGQVKKVASLLTHPNVWFNYILSFNIDPLGNFLISGYYNDSLSSRNHSFIGKYNKNGLPLWRKFGIDNSYWIGSDFDSNGNLFVVGNYPVNDSLMGSEQVWIKKLNYTNGATIASEKSPLQPSYHYDQVKGFVIRGNAIYCIGGNVYDQDNLNPYYDNSMDPLISIPIVFVMKFDLSGFRFEEINYEKQKDDFDFSLYPNPATTEIKITNLSQTENQISIYNLLGARVANFRKVGNSNEATINIADLPAGIYVVTIFDGEKIICKKFVKE